MVGLSASMGNYWENNIKNNTSKINITNMPFLTCVSDSTTIISNSPIIIWPFPKLKGSWCPFFVVAHFFLALLHPAILDHRRSCMILMKSCAIHNGSTWEKLWRGSLGTFFGVPVSLQWYLQTQNRNRKKNPPLNICDHTWPLNRAIRFLCPAVHIGWTNRRDCNTVCDGGIEEGREPDFWNDSEAAGRGYLLLEPIMSLRLGGRSKHFPLFLTAYWCACWRSPQTPAVLDAAVVVTGRDEGVSDQVMWASGMNQEPGEWLIIH